MEKKNSLTELMKESMAKVREMVDTNTIVGQPITTPDGVTLIPISRVSMGFGGGGAVFGNKKDARQDGSLGGGVGTGVKIDPVAFIIIKDGAVRMMPVSAPANSSVASAPNIVSTMVSTRITATAILMFFFILESSCQMSLSLNLDKILIYKDIIATGGYLTGYKSPI